VALAIEPEAAGKRRHAQNKNSDRKGQRDFGDAPSKLLGKRQSKYAPNVNGAQPYLQEDTSDGNTPTICFHNLFSKFYSLRGSEFSAVCRWRPKACKKSMAAARPRRLSF